MAAPARTRPGDAALILPPPRAALRRDLAEALATAGISGILLALSFPRYGHPIFAWVALAPLIVLLFTPRPFGRLRAGPSAGEGRQALVARAFLPGFVAGVGYFGGTVYWTG